MKPIEPLTAEQVRELGRTGDETCPRCGEPARILRERFAARPEMAVLCSADCGLVVMPSDRKHDHLPLDLRPHPTVPGCFVNY